MTKAKIMLSAVAAVAAVGGAFALKSKKMGLTALYTISQYDQNAEVQSCDQFLTLGTTNLSPLAGRPYYFVTATEPIVDPTSDNGLDGADCHFKYYTVVI